MAGFYFRLELEDGTPADPPILHTAVPNWSAGDTIPLGAERMLRVVEVRFGQEPGEDLVLLVINAGGLIRLRARNPFWSFLSSLEVHVGDPEAEAH
jgi:hypothetical protein